MLFFFQIDDVLSVIKSLNWTVGDLIMAVEKYCIQELKQFEISDSCHNDQTPVFTFFEYMLFDMYK